MSISEGRRGGDAQQMINRHVVEVSDRIKRHTVRAWAEAKADYETNEQAEVKAQDTIALMVLFGTI